MGQQKEARLRSLVVEPRKTSACMLTATNHDKYSIGCLVLYIFLVLIYTDPSKHTIKKMKTVSSKLAVYTDLPKEAE